MAKRRTTSTTRKTAGKKSVTTPEGTAGKDSSAPETGAATEEGLAEVVQAPETGESAPGEAEDARTASAKTAPSRQESQTAGPPAAEAAKADDDGQDGSGNEGAATRPSSPADAQGKDDAGSDAGGNGDKILPPPPTESAQPSRGGRGALIAGLLAGLLAGAGAGGVSGWYFTNRFSAEQSSARSEIDASIKALEARIGSRTSELAGNIDTLGSRLAALEKANAELAARLENVKKRLSELPSPAIPGTQSPGAGSDLAPRVDALGALLKEKSSQIKSLLSDLEAMKEEVPALRARIEKVEKHLAELEARMVELSRSNGSGSTVDSDELAAIKAALDAQIAENKALAEKYARLAAEAEARIAQAEARIAKAEAKAADLSTMTEAVSREARRAVALAELRAALESGAPYGAALATLRETGVETPEALERFAAEGVPTLARLREEFPGAARRALEAAIRASRDASLGRRVGAFLKSQIGIRSLEPRDGDDPDAVLSRAEAALRAGDLATALEEIGKLPPEAQQAMASWIDRAKARLAAEQAFKKLQEHLSRR